MSLQLVTFQNHIFQGVQWPVVSKRTGETYTVEMWPNGLVCNCHKYQYYSDCKHCDEIEEKISEQGC